jgi:hypothetical protein
VKRYIERRDMKGEKKDHKKRVKRYQKGEEKIDEKKRASTKNKLR